MLFTHELLQRPDFMNSSSRLGAEFTCRPDFIEQEVQGISCACACLCLFQEGIFPERQSFSLQINF
jgi:hypothetical protein